MSILDISNWTIDEINNSIDTFKDTSLTDIGMVNCDIDSINVVGEVTAATLWINEDVKIDGYTGTAPLKIYKEDKIEIKLNSPLLEGDTIEVIDGKLCHVHRYEKVILDGSKDEKWGIQRTSPIYCFETYAIEEKKCTLSDRTFCSQLIGTDYSFLYTYPGVEGIAVKGVDKTNYFRLQTNRTNCTSGEELKVWLQENPLTVIYKLAESWSENITPLQSEIVLKTFEECNMNIVTNLPIKTNVSYRTNVPSISTLSNRVAEVSESDSVIQNLIDIIDDEVDE